MMCVHIYTTHAYGSTTKITNRAWHIVEILGKTDKIKQANQKLKTKQKPLTYMFTADPWYHLKTSPQAISVYWHSRIIRMAQCNTDLTAGAWTTEQRISKALGNHQKKSGYPTFCRSLIVFILIASLHATSPSFYCAEVIGEKTEQKHQPGVLPYLL